MERAKAAFAEAYRVGALTQQIADPFDLTLECIRRHYLGETSPLAETLRRYEQFFALFEDFLVRPPADSPIAEGTDGRQRPVPRGLNCALGWSVDPAATSMRQADALR